MPKISVIVPAYKVERYLPRCVDSILAQTFTDFELILVDDGSPDNCGAICDEYAARDSRVRVIHQENAKVSAARNAGIEVCSGQWIAFVDPDDWLHHDYLRILYEAAEKDTDVVICDCLVTSLDVESDRDLDKVIFRNASLSDIEQNRIARTRVWGRLVRRSTLDNMRFIPGTEPAEDTCFNELFFRQDMKYRIMDAKLYYYYMRPDSAIHNNMGRGTLNSVEPILQRLQGIDDKEKRSRVIRRCYKNVLYARYLEMFAPDYGPVKQRCGELLRILRPYRKELDMKNRVIYGVLAASPQAYRLWRIRQDPTLLDYEKNQKRKMVSEKK